jgi:hypothetical protein
VVGWQLVPEFIALLALADKIGDDRASKATPGAAQADEAHL